MDCRTVLVLIFEPSTTTMGKIMITMRILENFLNRTIFGYTRVHDGGNAENQTKKSQKASAH